MAGEYTPLVVGKGLAAFLRALRAAAPALEHWIAEVEAQRAEVDKALGSAPAGAAADLLHGLPGAAGVLGHEAAAQEMGPVHVSADIGCHSFATFAPFSQGNSILGYGMSLASAAAVSGTQTNRPISVMGDGGFWHNGLHHGRRRRRVQQGRLACWSS